jgi:hypothetical protein
LIPVADSNASLHPAGSDLSLLPVQDLALTYAATAGTTGTPNTFAPRAYQPPQTFLEIVVPQPNPTLLPSFTANLSLLVGNLTVGIQQNVTFTYSPQTGRYVTPLDGVLWPGTAAKPTISDAAQTYLKTSFGSGALPPAVIPCQVKAEVMSAGNVTVSVNNPIDLQLRRQ